MAISAKQGGIHKQVHPGTDQMPEQGEGVEGREGGTDIKPSGERCGYLLYPLRAPKLAGGAEEDRTRDCSLL